MSSLQENLKAVSLAVIALAVLIMMIIMVDVEVKYAGKSGLQNRRRAGFAGGAAYGTPASEVWRGPVCSGCTMRSMGTCRDDTGANDCPEVPDGLSAMLGGPEPPVFYNIGDVNASKAAVAGQMYEEHPGKALGHVKKEGFSGRWQAKGLSPY